MFENSEVFDNYITELIEKKLKTFAAVDGEYAIAKAEAEFEFDVLKGDFTSGDFTLIENFRGLLCDMYTIENRYLYFEGFTDCIRLLKRLEVY